MGFEEDFDEMRRKIDKMLGDFFRGRAAAAPGPTSHTPAGEGPRSKRENGNMRRTVEGQDPAEREPVYDLIEGEESIFVTVELPGTTPEKISLRASDRVLTVEAHGFRRYWKVLELPESVDASSLEWTFNNGVLDVSLTKRAASVRAD